MSYNPVESASKGAAEGVVTGFLNWGTDQVKTLAQKFKDKELSFIGDEKTINIVKDQYRSGEIFFYKEYIEDSELLFLLKMGLTLRKLGRQGEDERKRNLRNKVFQKYDVKGLHIAQFVENGILNRYIGILMDNIISVDKFKSDIMDVLKNIEKHVIFVKSTDNERVIIRNITSITTSHIPMVFIVSGIYSAAQLVRGCEQKIIKFLDKYELEKISSKDMENLFFKRIIED